MLSPEKIVPVISTTINKNIAAKAPAAIPRDFNIFAAINPAKNDEIQEDAIAVPNTAPCDRDFIFKTKKALKNSISIKIMLPNRPPNITARVIDFIVTCCDFSLLK